MIAVVVAAVALWLTGASWVAVVVGKAISEADRAEAVARAEAQQRHPSYVPSEWVA